MKSIVITGNQGGIGKVLQRHLNDCGYKVIGIDVANESDENDIKFDLNNLHSQNSYDQLKDLLNQKIADSCCVALINNAAVQILGKFENLDINDFKKTMSINLEAPLMLSQLLLPELMASNGNIINIGSIHATLTKPGFVSYSTSKAALLGLTKSMAVEIGNKVKINMISPAAINTEMLVDGFKNNKEKLLELDRYHPASKIGHPKDIAKLVEHIIKSDINFLNGSNITLDGGISSRLHDPL
tara:strand:- start:495 stop:1220 length:726 start_codon:yes stop_codon:yes gene_type:complete